MEAEKYQLLCRAERIVLAAIRDGPIKFGIQGDPEHGISINLAESRCI